MSEVADANLIDLSMKVDISDINLTKSASDTSDQSILYVIFLNLN